MKKTLFACVFFGCALGLTTVPLAAQETENSFFTGGVGAGFSTPVYHTGTALDMGWNFQAQAGINLFDAHLSLLGEFVYNNFGINSSTLAVDGFPGGTTSIWGF